MKKLYSPHFIAYSNENQLSSDIEEHSYFWVRIRLKFQGLPESVIFWKLNGDISFIAKNRHWATFTTNWTSFHLFYLIFYALNGNCYRISARQKKSLSLTSSSYFCLKILSIFPYVSDCQSSFLLDIDIDIWSHHCFLVPIIESWLFAS